MTATTTVETATTGLEKAAKFTMSMARKHAPNAAERFELDAEAATGETS